jgi:DNA polymerase V
VSCTGFKYRDLFDYVKDKISLWSGVPVSIGIGATKTLSKLANRIAKKKYRAIGVYIIDSEDKRINALRNTDVNDVWGVG